MGEEAGYDDELLPLLDAANVCCGAHAGSPATTAATVRRCSELGVQIGAHPGYADRSQLGRTELGLTPAQIEALIREQVAVVAAVARPVFVKPHGALFHRCQADPEAAAAAARATRHAAAGLVGQPGFALLAAAAQAGIPAWREGYADRGYEPDGTLVARGRPGDLLAPEEAAAQAVRLAKAGGVDVICLHGDSPHALAVAQAVRAALAEAGIATGPLRSP